MRAPFKLWWPSTRPAKRGTQPSVRWDPFPLIALDSEDFTTHRRMPARATLKYCKLAER